MLIDAQLRFDNDAEHLSDEASTNIVDLGSPRDIGVGEDLYFVCQVTTAFTDSSSNSTMEVTLETDDNESFTSAKPVQTIGIFSALSPAGSRLVAKLAPGAIDERYLRVNYDPANGDLTTGKFTSFLTTSIDSFKSYPAGYTIS